MVQAFTTTDVLRFEVEDDPVGLVNLIQNPSGDLGGWGWITPLASSTTRQATPGVDAPGLLYRRTVAGASYFTSEDLPVAAGQYVAAYWVVSFSFPYVRARFEWYNAAGALLSSSAQSAYYNGTDVPAALAAVVAPAGTVRARLRFDVYDNTAGANPTGDHTVVVRDVTVAAAATSAALQTVRKNLAPNPSFETNATGWTARPGCTALRSTTAHQVGAASLAVKSTGNGNIIGASTTAGTTGMPVVGGAAYAMRCGVRAAATARPSTLFITWYGATGAVVGASSSGAVDDVSGAWTARSFVETAPPSAVYASVAVEFFAAALNETHYVDAVMFERADAVGTYFDGATPDAGGWDYAWTGTTNLSVSTATLSALQFIEPVPYLDVLGPTHDLKITRDELEVGLLTATILDATLDPAKADLFRPGRRVRVLALDPDAIAPADPWTPLFVGKATNATVTYDYKTQGLPDAKRARITLSAADNVSAVAAVPRSEGVALIDELPYLLEGAGIPWSVNGSGNQIPAATVVARNANASLLDQVAITRDSRFGYAWVDRRGVVNVWDAASMPAVSLATFDESTYTDLAIDYDTERCINTVTLKYLRINLATGETVEVPYGPYVDQHSIDLWGSRSAEFTVQGIVESPANMAAYAAAVLSATATPVIRATSVTIAVRTAAEVEWALRDLYDLVTVENDDAGFSEDQRIIGVEHTISADPKGGKWVTTYSFAADGGVAPPQPTPTPPAPTPAGGLAVTAAAGVTVTDVRVYPGTTAALVTVNITTTAALAAGATLFTLPDGTRPPATIFGDLVRAGTEVAWRIHIGSSGVVVTDPALASGSILRGQFVVPQARS